MKPKVVVIILNWNGWRDTLQCINSLRQVSYPTEKLNILLVDNGSTDESVLRFRSLDKLILLPLAENIGFSSANNVGIRRALDTGCDYVMLLNNDTVVTHDFLDSLLEVFEHDPTAGIVSPKIYCASNPNHIWYAGGRFKGVRLIGEMVGHGVFDQGQYDVARSVDFAVGCCMLIKGCLFSQIGYLDERFFFYHEDVDYSYRARRAGFSVWYQPASTINHKVSRSVGSNSPLQAYYSANARTLFFFKHIRGPRTALVCLLELIRLSRIVVRSYFTGDTKIAHSYVRGLLEGVSASLKVCSISKM